MTHPDDPQQAPDLRPDDVAWTDALILRPSPINGFGVFARRHFEEGDVVERVPVILVPDEDMPSFRVPGSIMQ